jgi:hypothetical protein
MYALNRYAMNNPYVSNDLLKFMSVDEFFKQTYEPNSTIIFDEIDQMVGKDSLILEEDLQTNKLKCNFPPMEMKKYT